MQILNAFFQTRHIQLINFTTLFKIKLLCNQQLTQIFTPVQTTVERTKPEYKTTERVGYVSYVLEKQFINIKQAVIFFGSLINCCSKEHLLSSCKLTSLKQIKGILSFFLYLHNARKVS